MVYMDFLAEYNRKKRTPEEAVSVVKSGDWVDYTWCTNHPYDLDKALAARQNELEDVKVRGGVTMWMPENISYTIHGTAAPMRDSCATRGSATIFP